MNDSLKHKVYYLKPFIQEVDSVRKDIKGIYTEIKEYNKQQKEKPDVSADTIYTVKITLIVFIVGILIERAWKFVDEKLNEADTRKFFIFHLKRVNENLVSKLQNAYKKYHDDVSIDTGITSTPPQIISSDFQRLLSIDHKQVFKAYRKKDVLSRIMSQIALIDKVQIEVKEFHDRVRMDTGKIRKELEVKTDEYLSRLNEYLEWEKVNNVRYEHFPTYQLINSLIVKYYSELAGTRMLSSLYTDIIRVVQKHLIDTRGYKNLEILAEIVEKGRKLSHLISKLQAVTKEITNQYMIYSEYMKTTNTTLESLISQLK